MNLLCQYKDIFGKPNEGAHSYRFMDIAIVDLLLTILASILISYKYNYNLIVVFIVLMVIGFLLHLLFCVETTLVKLFKRYFKTTT